MKNIFLLPTDKPSRLFWNFNKLSLGVFNNVRLGELVSGRNIYITSDEEIKEGDAVIHDFGMGYEVENPCDKDNLKANTRYKIILTNDQDLIKDGVQAIPDEFLEWFVNNPSCEEVEVGYGWIRLTETDNEGYWISIPDKQFEMQQEEPQQETLEEAAERLFPVNTGDELLDYVNKKMKLNWIAGAKWQQEQDKNKYSEEEVLELLNKREDYINSVDDFFEYQSNKEWFEQFKKKTL